MVMMAMVVHLPLTLDWLDNNYTPDVSGEVGDGQILLLLFLDGGIGLTGQ